MDSKRVAGMKQTKWGRIGDLNGLPMIVGSLNFADWRGSESPIMRLYSLFGG